MFSIFRSKPIQTPAINSGSARIHTSSPTIKIIDESEKKDELEAPLGSYRIHPTVLYNMEKGTGTQLAYEIQIYNYDIRGHHSVHSEFKPTWHSWRDYAGNQKTFENVEDALEFYKCHRKEEHKASMHMMQGPTATYNPYHFILDEARELGVEAELSYDKESKLTQLVFNSEEDMNFYKLSSIYQEDHALVFTSK